MSFDSEVLADSPVAYWKYADASGTTATDSSGNSHAGTYANVTLGQAGLISGESDTSAAFNGASSAVAFGTPSALDFVGAMTLEAIVKPTWFDDGTQHVHFIAGKGYDGDEANFFRILEKADASKELHIGVYLRVPNTNYDAIAEITWASGETHIVCGQFTGTQWQLFVDGVSVANFTTSQGSVSNSLQFSSGAEFSGSFSSFFNGRMEKLSAYSAALSSARVLAHAVAAGFATVTPTITAATLPASGDTITLMLSASASGLLANDFAVLANGRPIGTTITGSGTTWYLRLNSTVTAGQSFRLSYFGSTLAKATRTVTNSSTVLTPANPYIAKRFGTFITWGSAAIPALSNPVTQAALNTNWDPTSYDMDAILDAAQAMGAAYTVFTAKHDGAVCMFATASGAPSTNLTPWGTSTGIDILKEYTTKARSRGLGVGVYLNFFDPWYTDLRPGHDGTYGPPSTFTAYISQQITEILTNYGKINYLWLDSWGYLVGYTNAPYATIHDLIKSLQPDCLILNNSHDASGNKLNHSDIAIYEDNEGIEPSSDNAILSEFCEPGRVDESWTWKITGETYKDPSTIASTQKKYAPRRTNYLLNINPTDLGAISSANLTFCQAIGAIIGTQGPVLLLPSNVKGGVDRGDGILGTALGAGGINGTSILGMI